MSQAITFVTDDKILGELCELWSKTSVLALDTEFIRTDTFYPIPALLQIYDGHCCYLLDLTVLGNYLPLVDVLKNKSIIKVLHSCSEDLEVFEGLLGLIPEHIFDTQIAAAFLGYGFSIGYSRLVKTLFDAEPPKDESRSNWLQRPLSSDQIEYASLDVIYLYKIYLHFYQQLQESKKPGWVEESHQEMIKNFRSNQQPEHSFLRIKSAWRLSPDQQEILFQLCLWREEEARRRNKPRNRILRDEALFEHAQHKTFPAHYRAATKQIPIPGVEHPLPREAGDLLKQLKQEVEKAALNLNIAPEVLGRKKDLTRFINSGIKSGDFQLPESLCGWRKAIIGDIFLNTAHAWHTNRSSL